ncbi:MAG: class A beta-lactamase-related serine hydrolase [Acidobacteria bacterium]|nr:class A beta-lactamase-related serine hydrolase [Acidobacteriota bacterium]
MIKLWIDHRNTWRGIDFMNHLLTALTVYLVICTLSVFSPGQAPKNFAQARRDLKLFHEKAMKENGIIGAGTIVIQDGEVIARELYGLSDRERGTLVSEETIFHWASITKTLTGIAIMQLRDQGALSLDDPIVKYIPELNKVHNSHSLMSEIRIRNLMSHSAGFRDPTWPWGGDKPWHPFEPKDWSQIVAMLPYTEILFKPGSRFSYSNPGVIFLGRVIEIISGEDFEVYTDKNILKPLEMYHSYFDRTPRHLLRDRSAGYYLRDGKIEPAPFDPDTGITVSNGGLNASLSDMVRYVSFLTGDPRRQSRYDQVLKRSSLLEMVQPQLPIDAGGLPEQTGRNRRDWAGLSFLIEENFGMKFYGHYGEQAGFVSHLTVRSESRTACLIAIITNATNATNAIVSGQRTADNSPNTMRLVREIREYLFTRIFPLFPPVVAP